MARRLAEESVLAVVRRRVRDYALATGKPGAEAAVMTRHGQAGSRAANPTRAATVVGLLPTGVDRALS
jgi:hypothetical protein